PSKAAQTDTDDAVAQSEDIDGMQTIELDTDDDEAGDEGEGLSPMATVAETPVETPSRDEEDAADNDSDDQPVEDARKDDASDTSQEDALEDTDDEMSEASDIDPDDQETLDEADNEADNEIDDDASEQDTKPRSRGRRRRSSRRSNAAEKDDSIEAVADDDDHDDIRPLRKPRPRRYKIQEVIKVRQILLVQVVKEERGNKGAALTTYLSLAGRYCVLMPNTARGGGISRKITNAADRKKLKEIATEIDVPEGAGLIVRTAGAKRTKSEIKRDYEYLQRMWEQIRELTLKSIAPAQIYEEGNLIKRSIRDLYNREIDEVLVEGDAGYRVAKDFMKMIMPSHAKNVKHYGDGLPLFARYQVESYLGAMFNPTVQLKSGGYIVIGVTEALVAIDVNSGRATKEGSIEETALKTNLEAAEEVARQLRLRDLAGLIVIDFIDMDERKNNSAVEKRLKDRLKSDRARIQVGRISGFGLLEMSRQRLRPGMIEATTQPCPYCHGTGLIRSDDNLALSILRQIEEEGVRRRSKEVLVKCPVGIANFLMNQKREHVAQIESRYGLSVRIEGDVGLISPDFAIEKFKTATRSVPEAAPVVSVDSSLMDDLDESEEALGEEAAPAPEDGEEVKPKKRRRRRRRRKSRSDTGEDQGQDTSTSSDEETSEDKASEEGETSVSETSAKVQPDAEAPEVAEEKTEEPQHFQTEKSDLTEEAKTSSDAPPDVEVNAEAGTEAGAEIEAEAGAEPETVEEKPKPKRAPRKKKAPVEPVEDVQADAVEEAAEPASNSEPMSEPESTPEPEPIPEPEPMPDPEPEPTAAAAPDPAPVEEPTPDPAKPKRRGWWSSGK
ncbi:MAG: Rne/Rng family ribonuclease, partial [Pseudomonadota bacterium]